MGSEPAGSDPFQEWQIPREAGQGLARRRQEAARRLVGGADRAAAEDRRLDRQGGRCRVPLRPPLPGQCQGAAYPGRSRWRASRHTASSLPRRTSWPIRWAARGTASAAAPSMLPRPPTSPTWCSTTSPPPACTQVEKRDTIRFAARPAGWPGEYICAEARFLEGETEPRAGIFVGPEYGTRHALQSHGGSTQGHRSPLRRADRLRLRIRCPCLRADGGWGHCQSSRPR